MKNCKLQYFAPARMNEWRRGMSKPVPFTRQLCLLACFPVSLLLLAPARMCFAAELPAASNVIQRVVARSELIARNGETNQYAYDKRSVTEELDDKERVTKSTERLYKVILVGGLPFPRLVKVQGRELTAKELEKENQREAAFRQKVTHIDVNKKAKKKEGLATQELVDQFDFKVIKREMIDGRATLSVTFAPKSNAPEKTIEEKIFKHVFGTIWVDEEEAEVAKLDASVRGPIPLGWFGAIGSLNQFQATLVRSRMPDGVWVNRKSTFWIVARKFLSAMRLKTTEESSDFRRE